MRGFQRNTPGGITGALIQHQRIHHDVERAQVAGIELRQRVHDRQEPFLLKGFHYILGEFGELLHILLTLKRPGAERMGVRDGQFVADQLAGFEFDLRARPEGLLGRIG